MNKSRKEIIDIFDKMMLLGHHLKNNKNKLNSEFFCLTRNKNILVADEYSSMRMKELLSAHYSVPLICEEDKSHNEKLENDCFVLIDPLDGSRSFRDCFCGWVIQYAVIKSGLVVESIVVAPEYNSGIIYSETFGTEIIGASGLRGFFRESNKPVCVIDNYPRPIDWLHTMVRSEFDYINCGSFGLKLILVYLGAANLFLKNVSLKLWDVAPMIGPLSMRGMVLTDGSRKAIALDKVSIEGLICGRAEIVAYFVAEKT